MPRLLSLLLVLTALGRAMTLDEAQQYAREHSKTLAQAQTDLDKADARIDEVAANYYPTLGLQGSFAYLSDVPVLAMSLGGGRSMVIPLGSHANYDVKLALSQTLYSGGRITNGYEAARLGREMTRQSIARKRQELSFDVHRAFNNILLLQEMLTLTRQGQARAQDHLKIVIALRDQGYVSKYDSLRTAVQVENLGPQIVKLENGIRLAREGFRLLIGMPAEEDLQLSGELTMRDVPGADSDVLTQALANRIELRLLDESIRLNELTRNITKGSYYPAVGVSAAYDLKNPASMGSSSWGTNLTMALGVNYTLFDGLRTQAQLRQADQDVRKLRITRQLAADGIAVEVKEALGSMASARAAEAGLRGSVAAADEGVRLAEARYAAGHGTNLDVLDAQLALYQSQVNLLSTVRDHDDAYARLVKAIGKEE
jgi:outer membrane protein TolC